MLSGRIRTGHHIVPDASRDEKNTRNACWTLASADGCAGSAVSWMGMIFDGRPRRGELNY